MDVDPNSTPKASSNTMLWTLGLPQPETSSRGENFSRPYEESNFSSSRDVRLNNIFRPFEVDKIDERCIVSQVWTNAPSVPDALVSVLLKLPNVKFVIVTLGEDGCMMLERAEVEDLQFEEIYVDDLFKKMKQSVDTDSTSATCISSDIARLHAKGIGTVSGKLLLGTAEKIPPSELVDTTGAGDAFIGAVLYALCANMPAERMLTFASQVAGIGCRALGARAGLPQLTDPRLRPFLMNDPQNVATLL